MNYNILKFHNQRVFVIIKSKVLKYCGSFEIDMGKMMQMADLLPLRISFLLYIFFVPLFSIRMLAVHV